MPCASVRTLPADSTVLAIALMRSNGWSALLTCSLGLLWLDEAEHDLVVTLALFGFDDERGSLSLVDALLGHRPADRVLEAADVTHALARPESLRALTPLPSR